MKNEYPVISEPGVGSGYVLVSGAVDRELRFRVAAALAVQRGLMMTAMRGVGENAVQGVLARLDVEMRREGLVLPGDELLERLAALEHEQWRSWAESLLDSESLSEERVERWRTLLVPYEELPEEARESDRVWARRVLSVLGVKL